MTTATQTTTNQATAAATIAKSAIVAGLLDATAGVIVYFIFKGLNPVQVLQYIASGVFGAAAFQGGLLMAGAGLVFHFIIAFAFAGAFFIVYPRIGLLRKSPVITGLLYGLFMWCFMNLLVLPNSAIGHVPFTTVSILEIIWHMALVGLPVALITEKYYAAKQ
jgi:uncharacterized membrane protein YagU involved in acid resistance